MLDERKVAILGALIEEYIESGNPVASRVILERSRLECSSATVRNELVVLERDGYVAQPHTSAGRVPTDRGFRYYVDHLSPDAYRSVGHTRIARFFSSLHSELGRILRETSDLLSEVTRYPAVVLGPGLRGHVVRDVHLLCVEPAIALLVLVTDTGRVHQSVLRPPVACTPAEVGEAQEALREALVDTTLPEEDDAVDTTGLAEPSARLVGSAMEAVARAADTGRDIYVGGASRMVALWEDLAKLRGILSLLEHEAAVLELLGGDGGEGTTVRLGHETGAPEDDLAVVSAPYIVAGSRGRMGVLGPLRMDYRRAIRAVEEVSDALGETLS